MNPWLAIQLSAPVSWQELRHPAMSLRSADWGQTTSGDVVFGEEKSTLHLRAGISHWNHAHMAVGTTGMHPGTLAG